MEIILFFAAFEALLQNRQPSFRDAREIRQLQQWIYRIESGLRMQITN